MVWKVAIVVPQKRLMAFPLVREKKSVCRSGRGGGYGKGERRTARGDPAGHSAPPRQVGSGVLRQSQRTFVGGTLFAGLAVLGLFKGEVDELKRPFAFRLAQEGIVQLMA